MVIESILDSVKQAIGGIAPDDTTFDKDLIMFTNGALMVMTQLGVGPATGYSITSSDNKWIEFIGDRKDLEAVKTDVCLRVRLVFDPPQNSFLVKAIEDQIKECDWRIEINHIPYTEPVVEPVTTEV